MEKNGIYKASVYCRNDFGIAFSLSNINYLECVSMKHQECKTRPEIIIVNPNEPVFYHISIKANKCSRSCNGINDPYAKLRVPDIIKNVNVKAFNLMSRINEIRHIIWQGVCRGCHCCQCSTLKWLTLISRVEFSFLKMM